MRLQRQGMVQTEVIFLIYIYICFKYEVHLLKTLHLSSHIFFLSTLQDQYIFCYQVILYVLRCLQAEENISG